MRADRTTWARTQALGFVAPLVYFIFIILSTLRLDFWLSTFTGAVGAVELLLHRDVLSRRRVQPPTIRRRSGLTTLPAASSCCSAACSPVRSARGCACSSKPASPRPSARDRVTNLFGQHVSPQVVERLLQPDADGHGDTEQCRGHVRRHSRFHRGRARACPRDVVMRLDDAFAILVEIVDRNGGIVNKFLGDGFLALFGAPIHDPDAARHAVTAAREMLRCDGARQ